MNIFITGDTHADIFDTKERIHNYLFGGFDYGERMKKLYTYDSVENVVLIILGDFGGNFGGGREKTDIEFKKMLEDFGISYFVIRGNHDQRPSKLYNHRTWHMETLFEGPTYVENDFPHIHYAMDGPWVYNINGKKTLVLPGAYSVDKYWRLANEEKYGQKLWFEDEQMNEREREEVWKICENHNYKFDVILSHTCPWSKILRYSPNFSFNKLDRIDQTMEYLFDDIDQKVQYTSWFWGHHHDDLTFNYNGHHNCLMYRWIYNFDDEVGNFLHGYSNF